MKKTGLKEYFDAFRVQIALKLVLTGIICILINNIFHFELGYFAALFSLLLLVLSHGEVFKVGAQAFFGCIISGTVSIIISYLLIESKVPYVLAMSVWIFIVVALLVRYFIAMLISGVAATMIMYSSIYDSVTVITTLLENYTLQLFIAVVVSSIIDALVWPHRSRSSFQLTLKTVYEEFSELFKSFADEKIYEKKDHQSITTSLTTFSNLVTYVNRMQKEERNKDFPMDQYMKIITFSRGIFIKTEVLEEFVLKEHSFMKDGKVAHNLNQILIIISESFTELAQSIGTKNVVNIEVEKLDSAISALHELYRKMHEAKGMEDDYYEDLYAFGAMLPVLDDVSTKVKRITEAINIFHRDEYEKMLETRVTRTKKVEKVRARSFFSIDGQSAKVGIKTVVIFLLLMFGEMVIGLPGGSQVVFFAILFGIIPNLGQAYMKSKYGVLGVFCGLVYSSLSLIVVMVVPSFLIVICLYSLGTFMAAYVASSSKDISAAGLQAGLLFPFGILLTTGPDIEINEALTRFLALLSAVFIGLIVQHTLWPVNPYKVLLQKISKSISLSGQIISKLLTTQIKGRESVADLVLPLAATLPTSTSLLHDAEYIIRHDELHAEEFMHIIESIELIYADLETLKRTVYTNMDSELFHLYLDHMASDYKQLCSCFDEVSSLFSSPNRDMATQISDLKAKVQEDRRVFRDSDVWRKYEPRHIEMNVLTVTSVDSLLDSLYKITCCINTINGVEAQHGVSLQPSKT